MKRTELKRTTPLRAKAPMNRTPAVPKEAKPARGPKPKTCKACRQKFVPRSPLQVACGVPCAIEHGTKVTIQQKAKQQRQERAETKKKLLALEPLEYYLKKAERACNAYIRKRDEGQGCISCGRHDADVWNAGHFISVGANRTLRFDEDNIHLQCARPCNKDKGGNIHEYRKGLLKKIGPERVARLDGWHEPVKMTREKAQEIEAYYKTKLRALKKETA